MQVEQMIRERERERQALDHLAALLAETAGPGKTARMAARLEESEAEPEQIAGRFLRRAYDHYSHGVVDEQDVLRARWADESATAATINGEG